MNPVLSWAVNNAIMKMDPQENIMLDKAKSPQRIDPIAAVINAYARAMYHDTNHRVAHDKTGSLSCTTFPSYTFSRKLFVGNER